MIVREIEIDGNRHTLAVGLSDDCPPSSETDAIVGQTYFDHLNQILYVCTADTPDRRWKRMHSYTDEENRAQIKSIIESDFFDLGSNRVIFSDDFDLGYLDTTKWTQEAGNVVSASPAVNDPDNLSVQDGMLKLTCKKSKTYQDGTAQYSFTGASLNTCGKFEFGIGTRVEARVRFDHAIGQWGAFWLLGGSRFFEHAVDPAVIWPQGGEIDIFEYYNGNGTVETTLHYLGQSYEHQESEVLKRYGLDWTQWHIIRMDFADDRLDFFVDDVLYGTHQLAQADYSTGDGTVFNPYNDPNNVFQILFSYGVMPESLPKMQDNGYTFEDIPDEHSMYVDWVKVTARQTVIPASGIRVKYAIIPDGDTGKDMEISDLPQNGTIDVNLWDTLILAAETIPAGSQNKTLYWKVLDEEENEENIFYISNGMQQHKGQYTPTTPGLRTVRLWTPGGVSTTVRIHAADPLASTKIECTGITLSSNALTIKAGETEAVITASLEPADTTEVLTWASDNESVAYYEEGRIIRAGAGNCVVTASCGNAAASCSVTVEPASSEDVEVLFDFGPWKIGNYSSSGDYEEVTNESSEIRITEKVALQTGKTYRIVFPVVDGNVSSAMTRIHFWAADGTFTERTGYLESDSAVAESAEYRFTSDESHAIFALKTHKTYELETDAYRKITMYEK